MPPPGRPDGVGGPPASPEERKYQLLQARNQLRSVAISDDEFQELEDARRAANEATRQRALSALADVEEQLADLDTAPSA